MFNTMQSSLIVGSLATLVFILFMSKRFKMNIRYTVVWILWSLVILVLSLFPQLIDWIANVLNISTPVNAVFLVFIFLVYLMSFYLYIRLSNQNEQIKTLTYQVSELKKQAHPEDKHE